MSINLDPKVFKDAATNIVKKSCQWEVIFKSTKPGDMDDCRHQTTVDDRTFRGKDIKAIQNKILELGQVIHKKYQWMERKLIRSVAGGGVQEQHTDFVKKDMEGLEDGQFPVSVLAPLNQAAKLHIGDKATTIFIRQVLFSLLTLFMAEPAIITLTSDFLASLDLSVRKTMPKTA